tara:strand:+ start:169 stop:570 length:402 start_codon:yes stop_codon:yes gene_type:complete
MKVAIVGSRKYNNRRKIKEFIHMCIEEFGKDVTIISGGCKQGADHLAKKYALELGAQYQEYPPFHDVHNLYCVLPESCYSKPYSVRYFFVRNKQIAKACDRLAAFVPNGSNSPGTLSTLKYAKMFEKRIMVID